MKAISIRQPWLYAILDIADDACPKRVENRKGIAIAREDHGHTSPINPLPVSPRFPLGFDQSALPRGCFLGIARIVDIVMHPPAFVCGALTSGYRIAGQLGLTLADVRKLPPVIAPGSLGLYNVEHRPRRYLLVEEDGYARRPKPGFVNFGEHRDAYAAAWAELAAKGAT